MPDPARSTLVSPDGRALEPLTDGARERSNWDALSLLRFGLALVVAVAHVQKITPGLGWLGRMADMASFEAVLGFLLISGFSIGHSIQHKPRGFFARRLWRIYPVYLAALVLTYAVGREPFTALFAGHFFLNLFFLNQVFTENSYVAPAWSLSLEIWLYTLAPFLIRRRATTLEFLAGASFACYLLYTCGRSLWHWPGYTGTLGGLNLPTLAFVWIAGFYLSVSPAKSRPLKLAGFLLAAHLILTIGIQAIFRFKHRDLHDFAAVDLVDFLGHALPLLVAFLVFCGVMAHRFSFTTAQHRLCRFCGDVSYPLYLVHLPAFAFCLAVTRNPALLLLAALALATAVYLSVDFYSRRRR